MLTLYDEDRLLKAFNAAGTGVHVRPTMIAAWDRLREQGLVRAFANGGGYGHDIYISSAGVLKVLQTDELRARVSMRQVLTAAAWVCQVRVPRDGREVSRLGKRLGVSL